MTLLKPGERERIDRAVVEAERRTSAEFMAVLARRADGYVHVPLVVAAVAALFSAAAALMIRPGLPALDLLVLQVAVFAFLALALRWPPLLLLCVPRAIKRRRARRMAREMFVDLGLLNTEGRTGVLFFVAAGERHVEIIADRGISRIISDVAWQDIVDRFVAEVKASRLADGIEGAIAACGTLLAEHLPAAPDDRNELRDGLIEL